MFAPVERKLHVSTTPEDNPTILRALTILLQALDYASNLNRDPWEFAVEIQILQAAGVTRSDLRWLRCKELVEHAIEITLNNDQRRIYQTSLNLSFNKRSCFKLTVAGAHFSRSIQGQPKSISSETVLKTISTCDPSAGNGEKVGPMPVWDRDRQILRLSDQVVKQFKTPAPNQEAILSAFQEEGWPPRIDDPIPPQLNQDPKVRLHDAINALNRNQKHRLIRFMGDGSGQGIRWELIEIPVPVVGEVREETYNR